MCRLSAHQSEHSTLAWCPRKYRRGLMFSRLIISSLSATCDTEIGIHMKRLIIKRKEQDGCFQGVTLNHE